MSLETSEATESFYAVPGEGSEWEFVENDMSALFKYAAGDDWVEMVYGPYYVEFWQPVLDMLKERSGPTEVLLSCTYNYGNVSESDIHGKMDQWRTDRLTRTKPNMLAVSDRDENSHVTTVHLVVNDIQVREIADIEV